MRRADRGGLGSGRGFLPRSYHANYTEAPKPGATGTVGSAATLDPPLVAGATSFPPRDHFSERAGGTFPRSRRLLKALYPGA